MATATVVAATANPKKLAEIEAIFERVAGDVVLAPRPADLADVVEDGATLHDNAALKAVAVSTAAGRPAIADDTGLEVDAIDGSPGVRSARFAGDDATDADNVDLLLTLLTGIENRRARFRTVICLAAPGREPVFAEGVCEGTIVTERRGASGFGYDPVFVPDDGDGRTFAEMTADEKHSISHRGRAMSAAGELLGPFLAAFPGDAG